MSALMERLFGWSIYSESSYRSDDVSSQHPVSLLVTEDLHHAVSVGVGLGSAVGCEGELADSVWDALKRRGRVRLKLCWTFRSRQHKRSFLCRLKFILICLF